MGYIDTFSVVAGGPAAAYGVERLPDPLAETDGKSAEPRLLILPAARFARNQSSREEARLFFSCPD